MRTLIVFAFAILPLQAADVPMVEKFLHEGQYPKGEKALELALAAEPKNDQIRFSLGLLQCFQAIEHLGQGLHEYGARNKNTRLPLLRLPVPENPKPTPVTYTAMRRLLESVYGDIEKAEATLAGVRDDNVKLPLRLAGIRCDFAGNGKASDNLLTTIVKINGGNFEFLKESPDFRVHFDRGDVAWMRAYCHLMMGLIDLYLAMDIEDDFDRHADSYFAERLRRKPGRAVPMLWEEVRVREPSRLGRLRKHLLAVTQLNQETWKHIQAETDDDNEWLPNPRQKGVIGLRVRDEQITGWLAMMKEIEGLLDGTKVIPNETLKGLWPNVEGGLNVKRLLDDPPEKFNWMEIIDNGPTAKYLEKNGAEAKIENLIRVWRMFESPYMFWFN